MPEAQIRYETNELRLLFEVSQALEGITDISDQMERALELMARHTAMKRAVLRLFEPDGELIAESALGFGSAEQRRARFRLEQGIMARTAKSGKAMFLPHGSDEADFLSRTWGPDLTRKDIAFICVPVLLEGKSAGALLADALFGPAVRYEEDARLLQVLASIVARAVKVRQDFTTMHEAVVEENRRLQQMVRERFHADDIVASSAAMRSVMEELAHVADSASTVLLRGESGTGKELAASIIHANSPRAGRPFIKVNCAALPEGLVESELFGYERGAFTGAVSSRKGRFEMAHGGTLFLDEVGDMTPLTQAKFLRAVQEREFERVGGGETIQVDVRLIAATNRDLEDMVARGEFRQDLYYRLSVFPIILPPLRERRDDIMSLVTHFVDKIARDGGRKIARITPAAVRMLMNYDWPGNIRELENVIERAVILSGADGVIEPRHLPAWLPEAHGPEDPAASEGGRLDAALAALEKRLITEALTSFGGNMARAAQGLGITERIMGLRMKKYGLDYRSFRKDKE